MAKKGVCPNCGYKMTSSDGNICPECLYHFDDEKTPSASYSAGTQTSAYTQPSQPSIDNIPHNSSKQNYSSQYTPKTSSVNGRWGQQSYSDSNTKKQKIIGLVGLFVCFLLLGAISAYRNQENKKESHDYEEKTTVKDDSSFEWKTKYIKPGISINGESGLTYEYGSIKKAGDTYDGIKAYDGYVFYTVTCKVTNTTDKAVSDYIEVDLCDEDYYYESFYDDEEDKYYDNVDVKPHMTVTVEIPFEVKMDSGDLYIRHYVYNDEYGVVYKIKK